MLNFKYVLLDNSENNVTYDLDNSYFSELIFMVATGDFMGYILTKNNYLDCILFNDSQCDYKYVYLRKKV